MIELAHGEILLVLQWADEKWWALENEKGFGDQRITDAQKTIEGIQNALKEAL